MNSQSQDILSRAIKMWEPTRLVCLYSGGYDSAVTTHLMHTLGTHGLDIHVAAIDTQLAADGWHEYVSGVADKFNWNLTIHRSDKAWGQFLNQIKKFGCPKSRPMHTIIFNLLKGRVIEAIHMGHKKKRSDKTLFVSGLRQQESAYRKDAPEMQRIGKSNRVFASPIVYWSQSQCDTYRVENGIPDNPFYSTVKGSGDCQCNWGDFITLDTLKKYSPALAAGNVALIDKLSKEYHGFGWHSQDIVSQYALFSMPKEIENVILTSPFLCQGCSRAKIRASSDKVEAAMLQRGLLF